MDVRRSTRSSWAPPASHGPSRWQLRSAVKVVNQMLAALDLEKHPDKTFIGRIARGFDSSAIISARQD
jgi:hypothetical protein